MTPPPMPADPEALEAEGVVDSPHAEGKLRAIYEIVKADIDGRTAWHWIDRIFESPGWTYINTLAEFRAATLRAGATPPALHVGDEM